MFHCVQIGASRCQGADLPLLSCFYTLKIERQLMCEECDVQVALSEVEEVIHQFITATLIHVCQSSPTAINVSASGWHIVLVAFNCHL